MSIAVFEGDFYSAFRRCELFRNIGSITHRYITGRPRVRTENIVHDVRQRMHVHIITYTFETGLSFGSCHTIVKEDLNLFPLGGCAPGTGKVLALLTSSPPGRELVSPL